MNTRNPATLLLVALLTAASSGCVADAGGDGLNTAYNGYLNTCASCHAPEAPGKTSDTEQALDFSTVFTARSTLSTGSATGLVGNPSACNGVPFVVAGNPAQSLIIAVLDQETRKLFDLPSHPNCDNDAITDMALKVGGPAAPADLDALKQWIAAGAL